MYVQHINIKLQMFHLFHMKLTYYMQNRKSKLFSLMKLARKERSFRELQHENPKFDFFQKFEIEF